MQMCMYHHHHRHHHHDDDHHRHHHCHDDHHHHRHVCCDDGWQTITTTITVLGPLSLFLFDTKGRTNDLHKSMLVCDQLPLQSIPRCGGRILHDTCVRTAYRHRFRHGMELFHAFPSELGFLPKYSRFHLHICRRCSTSSGGGSCHCSQCGGSACLFALVLDNLGMSWEYFPLSWEIIPSELGISSKF